MSMSQLLGVWNATPRTQAAQLGTENMRNAAWTYAAMDKAVNTTQTTTTKTKSGSNFLGDVLPIMGGVVGGLIGEPTGTAIGGNLGGIGGSLMGGTQAGAIGGMIANGAQNMGNMLQVTDPFDGASGSRPGTGSAKIGVKKKGIY